MESATPMLKQYQQIKSKYKDCILFFRLGDFYEMFFDDARIASQILELVLTSRGKDGAGRIPMCGVPYHAADHYIAKLIKAGQKVAICEQLEDPALAKGIVKREVIRVVTSGTFLDDSTESRYLLSLSPANKSIGIAFTDTATGTLFTNEFSGAHQTIELMTKLPICECIFPEGQKDRIRHLLDHPLLKPRRLTLTSFEDWSFNTDIARQSLCEHFATHNLKGFGIEELPQAQSSCGALLAYLKQMNKQPLRHIDRISLYADSDYVFISPAAHYGLELETLLATLDGTQTPMGRRTFRFWLYHPLKNPAAIFERQDAVTRLKNAAAILEQLNGVLLRNIPDVEKSLSRLSCGVASFKDFLAIRQALLRIPEIQAALTQLARDNALFTLTDLPALCDLLERAINPDLPNTNAEGKIIRPGYNKELDELRNIQDNGREWLKQYQSREIQRTKINSLKVGFNRVFGYYIEVTKSNLGLVPADYIRKQTIVNGERFITPDLKAYEEKILTAQERILALEQEILTRLQQEILDEIVALHSACEQLGTIDALTSLGLLAQKPKYCAPDVDQSTEIMIQDGRHPVVEGHLTEEFIPNDTALNCEDSHLVILTGPNMAGKSTYIRQNAVLVIMAQMGSYIPAKSARIGIVDKIFTRIGAHDEITKGQSTFMVEMTETADILNNLTPRSLVILDEIGRGTSTSDGLSLAWALAEHLQQKKARTLFATHFHELVALADQYSGIRNYNVAVKEWEDKIIFLHKIVPGGTDDSYGIYVAKLAGIPSPVISRAKKILTELETGTRQAAPQGPSPKSGEEQLGLFSATADPIAAEITQTLAALDLNTLTPIEALNKLSEFKKIIER